MGSARLFMPDVKYPHDQTKLRDKSFKEQENECYSEEEKEKNKLP